MTKATAMKILGLLGGALGTAIVAYKTGNVTDAIIAGLTALVMGIAGLNHPTPAAVKAFGPAAK